MITLLTISNTITAVVLIRYIRRCQRQHKALLEIKQYADVYFNTTKMVEISKMTEL